MHFDIDFSCLVWTLHDKIAEKKLDCCCNSVMALSGTYHLHQSTMEPFLKASTVPGHFGP